MVIIWTAVVISNSQNPLPSWDWDINQIGPLTFIILISFVPHWKLDMIRIPYLSPKSYSCFKINVKFKILIPRCWCLMDGLKSGRDVELNCLRLRLFGLRRRIILLGFEFMQRFLDLRGAEWGKKHVSSHHLKLLKCFLLQTKEFLSKASLYVDFFGEKKHRRLFLTSACI